jgi:hypothetical protein
MSVLCPTVSEANSLFGSLHTSCIHTVIRSLLAFHRPYSPVQWTVPHGKDIRRGHRLGGGLANSAPIPLQQALRLLSTTDPGTLLCHEYHALLHRRAIDWATLLSVSASCSGTATHGTSLSEHSHNQNEKGARDYFWITAIYAYKGITEGIYIWKVSIVLVFVLPRPNAPRIRFDISYKAANWRRSSSVQPASLFSSCSYIAEF